MGSHQTAKLGPKALSMAISTMSKDGGAFTKDRAQKDLGVTLLRPSHPDFSKISFPDLLKKLLPLHSKYLAEFRDFQDRIDMRFDNEFFLLQAFLHPSFFSSSMALVDIRASLPLSTQVLATLGDSVLYISTLSFLLELFPYASSGELTQYRAALVSNEGLSAVMKEHLDCRHLILANFEAQPDQSQAAKQWRDTHLAALTMEALVGAVYLDKGVEVAGRFVGQHLLPRVMEITLPNGRPIPNPVVLALEAIQKRYGRTPEWRLLKTTGNKSGPVFHVGVIVDEKLLGKGRGLTMAEARKLAASEALKYLDAEPP